ncbi:MAG: hypothetical protein ABIN41_04360 [Devosia sp.]
MDDPVGIENGDRFDGAVEDRSILRVAGYGHEAESIPLGNRVAACFEDVGGRQVAPRTIKADAVIVKPRLSENSTESASVGPQ